MADNAWIAPDLLDPASRSFANRLLGLSPAIAPQPKPVEPPPPPQPQRVLGSATLAPTPPATPMAMPKPGVADPLAQPQPYSSRVLAPGSTASEFLEYQRKINEQARRDAMFQQIGNSIRGIGASWSQDPDHVRALAAGAGAVGIPLPAGPMSAGDFMGFRDKEEQIRQEALDDAQLAGVAKSMGISKDQARALKKTNPGAFGEALAKLTGPGKAAEQRAERGVVVSERGAETAAAAEQRQRDELDKIRMKEEERKAAEVKRATSALSEDEIASAAQQLNEKPEVIRSMQRAEVEARLSRMGAPTEETKTIREIERERAKMPVPPGLTDPDEIAAWKRANPTPTEQLIKYRREVEVQGQIEAGPEATEFIKQQEDAHAKLRQMEQDAALRSKHREALGQGIITGGPFAQAGLEFEKLWQQTFPGVQMPKIRPTEAAGALQAPRLQAKAKTSGLGAGQGFTGKDAEIVSDAIGGSKTQTPEGIRRIVSLEAQLDRFHQEQVNDDIKARRLTNPSMAARSIVKPIPLSPIDDDMRRFADNDALASGLKSQDGYKTTGQIIGKQTTKDLLDKPEDVEKMIQAKLTTQNPQNKLHDVPDVDALTTYKNMSLRGLERNRDAIVNGWKSSTNNLEDRDASLINLIIEAKRAGKFGKIE